MATNQFPTRHKQLDAIRGIAALIVVFNHYIQTVPDSIRNLSNYSNGVFNISAWFSPWPWLRFTPIRFFVAAHAAVIVFFILSGFVLSLTVTKDKQPNYFPFIFKRICRIYIPFAAIILAVNFFYEIYPLLKNPLLSDWFNNHIIDIEKVSLIDHLLMTGSDISLNPVMWTLVHEMRVSFILPLVFLAARKINGTKVLAISIVISILFTFGIKDSSASTSWGTTAHFFWMFVAGVVLSFHREKISDFVSRMKGSHVVLSWMVAISLLVVPFDRVWCDFLIGVGAIMLISLSFRLGRIYSFLHFRAPLWLGRVSYSLYLVHIPIVIIGLSSGTLPWWCIFISTLAMSELVYRFLETPSHKLGVLVENTYTRKIVLTNAR